jgi:biotin-(acetyl-CoA carboxylase) ligase
MIGERITVTDGKEKYGIFEDIDESGFLLLKNKRESSKDSLW